MARIPDQLPQAVVEGDRTPTDVVPLGDLGLRNLAAGLDQANVATRQAAMVTQRAQAKADQEAALPALQQLQTTNEDAFRADAAAYTGEPGFAADQIAKARERVARADPGDQVRPGVRAQYHNLANTYLATLGERAIAHEATVRAQPIEDARKAQDQVALNGGLTSFFTNFGPAKQQLLDTYDGSQAGLTQSVGAAFDAAAGPALEATPERLRPQLQGQLAAQRTQEIAEASVVEQKGADAHVLVNSSRQSDTMINGILSDPLTYSSVVSTGIPSVLAALPAGLKKDAEGQLQAQAAAARINGLLLRGETAQAKTELTDGRYDQWLKPEAKTRLLESVDAAERRVGPKSFDEYMAAHEVEGRANAETYARMTTGKSTGQVNLDEVIAKMGPARAAEYATQWSAADKQFAVDGAVHDQPSAAVQAQAATPAPDPAGADYANKLVIWKAQQDAAKAELKARETPGAWAFTIQSKGPAAAGAGAAQDRGAALQAGWQQVMTLPPGPALTDAGARFAGSMLGSQYYAGIPAAARQIIPQAKAAELAAGVTAAAPEQKVHALQALAGVYQALPASFSMPDGSAASPRALLQRQLMAAHMTPIEVSAVVDFGDDPAKLGRLVAALNDPTIKGDLGQKRLKDVKAAVVGELRPYMATVAPLPGALELAQARIDRTALIATGLAVHQGLDNATAARTAAADLAGRYRYVDTWRMPQDQAAAGSFTVAGAAHGPMLADGASLARLGAAKWLHQLTDQDGTNLYAPAGLPGDGTARRALYSRQVLANGRWVTAPDDSGLVLMVPHQDGGWDPVADRYGRPVRATWGQLADHAYERAPAIAPAPANGVVHEGQPVAAASKQGAFEAVAWAVEGQESRFRDGAVGPGTRFGNALGRMQVIPQFGAPVALRVTGKPLDEARLLNDNAYNRQIGRAMLADQINHFGPGAGIGLAIAAYNAGPGRLEGYRDQAGYHPGWLTTIGDPRKGQISLTDFVARIPLKETREYVQSVLPHALARLEGR